MKGKSMNPHQNPFAGNTPQDVTERQGEIGTYIFYFVDSIRRLI